MSCRDVITKRGRESALMSEDGIKGRERMAIRILFFANSSPEFAFARGRLPPYYKRDMGQQHRVRVKRRRRVAYLERKKAAAKAAPVRREMPKAAKSKTKKQAPAAEES